MARSPYHWFGFEPKPVDMEAEEEMRKEGLIVVKELKRLLSNPVQFNHFMKSHVARLLISNLVAVLAKFQRQDLVSLSAKRYVLCSRGTKKVEEAKCVREDLTRQEVHFDQHTFGDIISTLLDSGLPYEAMYIHGEMRRSPDTPLSLPCRVMLKVLVLYPELREKMKDDYLDQNPGMFVYDPSEDPFEDRKWSKEIEDD